jgi:hypothetical protein
MVVEGARAREEDVRAKSALFFLFQNSLIQQQQLFHQKYQYQIFHEQISTGRPQLQRKVTSFREHNKVLSFAQKKNPVNLSGSRGEAYVHIRRI